MIIYIYLIIMIIYDNNNTWASNAAGAAFMPSTTIKHDDKCNDM